MEALPGILLVALATSLGWGLRGEWGHWWGATVPGAFCGMSLWLAFGVGEGMWQMISFGAVMAVSLSLGGTLSYGKIVGYVKSEHDRSPMFGVLALFLVGGLWGYFGGTALGLLVTGHGYTLADMALWAVSASIGAFGAYKILVVGLDLHLSPPRSDAWAAVLGGAFATALYFILYAGDWTVIRFAVLGWIGFGGGFSLGSLIHRACQGKGLRVDSWKFMEHSVGFWGGLSLAIAAFLHDGLDVIPIDHVLRLTSALVVLWLVPYLNISDNFRYWYSERAWISRRTYAIFQLSALLSLPLLVYLMNDLIPASADAAGIGIFVALLGFLTLMAIAKFRFDLSRVRLQVDALFLSEAAACALILALFY